MPVYTYRCENCGVQFDKTQKFSDPVLTKCPECGKKSLHKVYTPVGIVFKGSGFYATDHRSPSGGTRGSSNKTEEHKSESLAESKAEQKTETTPAKESAAPADGKKD
jgi:putative FmdB family regulatory protein